MNRPFQNDDYHQGESHTHSFKSVAFNVTFQSTSRILENNVS